MAILELLQLSLKSSCVKYYSDWIDEAESQPYLTVVPQKHRGKAACRQILQNSQPIETSDRQATTISPVIFII
ncbi:hypothetical protein [uncultured Nostoc sp.]|uniref:hypothetical protein n=1 Tax=uncultured Nostoc sp. TaxID=340711 RepID=UPI0035CB2C40